MRVAILSLRFAPGHIAHLRAYRELFKALGCEVRLFLDPDYAGFFSESSDVEFTELSENMQGSPVLVTDRGDSKSIVTEGIEGCFIPLPHDNEDIKRAFEYIKEHVDEMSMAARETFHRDYEYKVHLKQAQEVYEIQ